MAPFIHALLLLTAAAQSFAVPTDFHDPYPLSSFPLQASYHSTNTGRGPYTRLRDKVIETIWGPPSRNHHNTRPAPNPSPHGAAATSNSLYRHDVVLRFTVKNEEEFKALADASETLYLDVWESTDEWVDIRLAKDMVPPLLGLLPASLQNAHAPLMHDLAQAVLESYPSGSLPEQSSSHRGFTPILHGPTLTDADGRRELFFKDYQPLSVVYPWMRLMASIFPSHVRSITIGSSYEGRDILGLRVGVHPTSNDQQSIPRQTILITGGSHAREWVSISTVNYIAYSIITRYGKVPGITKLLEEFDLVFVPSVNPDGYVYTWDSDRLWRKNRQETDFRYCRGLDLDRAWGFEWDGQSATSNPCAENYAGSQPFDAVEARSIASWARNEIASGNTSFAGLIDLHSYSQQVLYPYSFSCDVHPPALESLQEVAQGLAKAFRLTSGHFYSVGPACEGEVAMSDVEKQMKHKKLERGGGSALDWFYHELKTKFTYQIKLRDTGSYGFLLPRSDIVPTGKETYNAVLALGKHLLGDEGAILDEATIKISEHDIVNEAGPENETSTLLEEEQQGEIEREDDEDDEDDEPHYGLDLKRRRRR